MSLPQGVSLPMFFGFYEAPVKVVPTESGGVAAWRLSKDSGGWQRADDLIERIFSGDDDEVDTLTREEFVQHTEHYRSRYLHGDGPVFALYGTVNAITDTAARERRYPTPEEVALVRGISRKTFVMFEEQLRQAGDPGADPSLAEQG